jgi:hypothetical protein
MKFSPLQDDFSGGEFSPLLAGRVTTDRYRTAMATCVNYIPTIQGALVRRPGTKFVSEVKTSASATRLMPFEFSTTQAYMLEFGDQYIRFYKDNGLITLTAQNITGITKANPAVVTYSGSDTYANGDRVIISSVVGMAEVNNREFTVVNVNTGANTFELSGVDSSAYTTYVSGGTVAEVYEIASPYVAADLFQIQYTQSADILYLVHPDYAPRKLSRTGHTSWTLTTIDFLDGPYLANGYIPYTAWTSTNGTYVYYMQATGTTGSISLNSNSTWAVSAVADNGSGVIRITVGSADTFTDGDWVAIRDTSASANGSWVVSKISSTQYDLVGSTYVNNTCGPSASARPGLFKSTDVGRHVRLYYGSSWGWAQITAYTDAGTVTATVKSTLGGTGDTTAFRYGLWSDTSGYPSTVTFHEDRLWFGASTEAPQRIDGSSSSDYYTFSPTGTDGVVIASNAVSLTLNSSDVNVIRWAASNEKGLLVGTVASEWNITPSSQNEAISPTNAAAKKATSYGSSNIQPVQAGKSTLFVQRSGKKIREMNYFYDVDGFDAIDLTELSEHITGTGVTQIAVQREPQQIIWAVREDGTLLGMTYSRSIERLKAGWHRHELGGTVIGTNGVESVAVIPSADGTRDELWLVVKRTINGSTKRYVEYLSPLFDDLMDQEEAFYVDSGLTYDGASTTSITGLWHLNAASVQALGDGAVMPNETVSNGAITLDTSAEMAHIGFGYNSDGKLLRIEGGSADGTSLGKIRRINEVSYLLHRSLGMKHGTDFDDLDTIVFRTTTDELDSAPELYTGIVTETIECDYGTEGQICFRQSQPLPSTILAIMPQVSVQEKG